MAPKTFREATWEFHEACLDLAFVFMRSIGIIWFVKRFGSLRQWAQDRDDGTIPLP